MAWDLATSKTKLEAGPIYSPALSPLYQDAYPSLVELGGSGNFLILDFTALDTDAILLTDLKDFSFGIPMEGGSSSELVAQYNNGLGNGLVIGLLIRK